MPAEPKRPLKVFLCHAHSDKTVVRELYLRLIKDDVDAWLDKEKLLPGQDWEYEIRKAVRESDVIVVCLSKQFNQAGFRQKEVRWALDTAMEQLEGEIFIIPARLDECEVPRSLRNYQWVDLFEDDGHSRMMMALKLRADRLSLTALPLAAREAQHQATIIKPKEQPSSDIKDQKFHKLFRLPKSIEISIKIVFFLIVGFVIVRFFVPSIIAALPTETPIPPTAVPSNTPFSPTPSIHISLIQSFPAPGLQAEGITWDGTNLWVTDNSATVFKLDSSGNVLDSFQSPEATPQGITWDGSYFWVFTTSRSFIYQLQINGGQSQIIGSFRSPAQVLGGDISNDMAWKGASLWYANEFKVYNLDTSGNILSSFTFSQNVAGLDWDGSNLWLAYNDFPNNATLVKVNANGIVLETYTSPIFQISSLAWADGSLWALGLDSLGGDPIVYKLNIAAN